MRRSDILFAAVVAAVLAFAGSGRADQYHNTEYRFTFDVPAGWVPCAADELKRANQISGEEFPGMEVNFVAGFRPTPPPRPTPDRNGFVPVTTPLRSDAVVFVQIDKRVNDKTSFEDLEKEITKDFAAHERGEPEAMIRLARRMIFTKPEFDHTRKRFIVSGASDGSRRHTVRSVGHLSPDGLVIVHGYTRPGGSDEDLAVITAMGDSFRFDEPEKPAPTALDRLFGDKVGPTGRMAIIGGAIALLVVAVGAFVLREKPDARRSRGW
jgi:hypothetical protein